MQEHKHNDILCSVDVPAPKKAGILSKISQRSSSLRWPLLFSGIFLVFTFVSIFPWDRVIKNLFASEDGIETISLYAHGVNPDVVSERFDEGWWGAERAKLDPELGPNADIKDFSDENSAFFAGGRHSLLFNAFQALRVSGEEGQADEPADTENVEAVEPAITEIPSEYPLDVEEFLDEASATVDMLPANETEEEPIEVIDESEINTDDTTNTEASDAVNTDDASDTPEQADEPAQDIREQATEPTSLLDHLRSPYAMAADALGESKELAELGDFKGARLRLSLAFASLVPGEAASETPETSADGGEAVTEQAEEGNSTDEAMQPEEAGPQTDSTDADLPETETEQTEAPVDAPIEVIEPAAEEPQTEIIDSAEAEPSASLFPFALPVAHAQEASSSQAKLVLWYSTDAAATGATSSDEQGLWQKLDTLDQEKFSNAMNGGYLEYEASFLASWEDIGNLKISIESVTDQPFVAYVDSVWVEADYDPLTELELYEKRLRYEEALKLISRETVFEISEDGQLVFNYTKNERRIWETLGEMVGLGDFWKDVSVEVGLYDASGQRVDMLMSIIFDSFGEISININRDGQKVKPGRYSLRFHIVDNSGTSPEIFDISQEFYWGVLVMNTDKDAYVAGEEAYVQMAVLDERGHTICDADMRLELTGPDGETLVYEDSGDGERMIVRSPDCGPETVTDNPDYSVRVPLTREGAYDLRLIAKTESGERSQIRSLKVAESPYVVKRQAATRIFPKADYRMQVSIEARRDFRGDISETLPTGFKAKDFDIAISGQSGRDPFGEAYAFSIQQGDDDEVLLYWQDIEILSGDILEISYAYDAPDRSPETYLAGPISMDADAGEDYREQRVWQIASDALNKRARTVMFQAGIYNGAAAAGNNTNTDYTMSAFNWRLAERGVKIENAYIVMETQFEAYNNTGGAYTGYKLGFDTCQETCTSAAFGTGAGQVLDDNASTLVYDETESNTARLLLDVTSEAQLAAYTGDSVLMESQFGYRLKNASTHTSIANASAVLVLTYTYDVDSPSITNTVVYPLDSTNGTDNGTRQAAQTTNCTADTNCPTFAYNMTLPEWQGVATSTNRVSQWFRVESTVYANTTTDVRPYLDIQTVNVDSDIYHYESALSSNSNLTPMYFPAWTNYGYSENASQQVEYYTGGPATTYMIGGEVFETYLASSSAATKTRTISLPMGVVSNGNSIALTSKDIAVYLFENGMATGTVDIKSAWVRLNAIGSITTTAYTVTVSSKVGNNATSSNQAYSYRANTSVVKPVFNAYYIVPAADYTELENANATAAKNFRLNLTYSNASFGGASAELMITYSYTSEVNGYATSMALFGGQQSGIPATSTTLSVANTVFPEEAGKSILAAGFNAGFFHSDTAANLGSVVHLIGTNISSSSLVCTSTYRTTSDSQNMQTEMTVDVSAAMDTVDDQSYSACFISDDTSRTTDVAKVNGQLFYTYGWINGKPTALWNSAIPRVDGSGIYDFEIEVDDVDKHDVRVKLEYEAGTSCAFAGQPGDPSLDETDANVTADHGDPDLLNANAYQLGVEGAYIMTASGSNSVSFDWLAANDLADTEGSYCLRLTANDKLLDQATSATTTVYIDTKKPSKPGSLYLAARSGTSLTIGFGATTTETNFKEYKIFYKQYDGTDPSESDSVLASSSDADLGNKLFNGTATTSITGLSENRTYSLAIWAYDQYGNRASSSRVEMITNDRPTGSFNSAAQRTDGSGVIDISIEADDPNNSDLLRGKVFYATGSDCLFAELGDPSLDENSGNVLADFGLPTISNSAPYQVGQSGAWIISSPGSNTVQFDWFGKQDLPEGNTSYCLGLVLNDSYEDQLATATRVLTIDNIKPAQTGSLSKFWVDESSIRLTYGHTQPASDTNPPANNAYRIFYKQGTSGVTEQDTEIDRPELDAYSYSGATSTLVGSLDQNTWYVFSLWAYDAYGNRSTTSELAIKTDASVSNQSLSFINPVTAGLVDNIAVAGQGVWTFRARVKEINGYFALASSTLRLANENDSSSLFSDFVFSWNQSTNQFTEIGADANSLVVLSPSSSASCAGNYCDLDFNLIFSKEIISSSVDFDAELVTGNDSGLTDHDSYTDFYQVRVPYLTQKHYRWRNDDGGE